MNGKRTFMTFLLMTLLMIFIMSNSALAITTTTDTISTSATANYSLYYDSSNGKMYTDEYGTNQYTGQSDKWSSAYNADAGSYILTLKGFNFTTSATDALIFPYDTTVRLTNGSTNTLTSTYYGSDYSSGIWAMEGLTVLDGGNGTGKLTAQGGYSTENWSDGFYVENTFTIISGHIFAYGGADLDSAGIDANALNIYSGEITAKGSYCGVYFWEEPHTVLDYTDTALFFGGSNAQTAAQLTITDQSDPDIFIDYPYLHIYHTLSDVPYNAWYYQNILDLYNEGIIIGYANNDGLSHEIRPNNPITRAEFVAILARLFENETDLEQYAGEYTFTDVPDWASKYVGWAAEYDYVRGFDNSYFGSAENITREQMAAILHRIVVKMELTSNTNKSAITFTDGAQITDFAKDAVTAMQKAGVINGYSNDNGTYQFKPKGQATRAEAFTMIYNFIKAYYSK